MKNQVNKIFILSVCLLLSLTLVNAATIFAGDSFELQLEKQFTHYTVTGNTTPTNLNVSQIETNVTIILDKYSPGDEFEITFYAEEEQVAVAHYSGGGGGVRVNQNKKVVVVNETVQNETVIEDVETEVKEEEQSEVQNETEEDPGLEKLIFITAIIASSMIIVFLIGILIIKIRNRKTTVRGLENNNEEQKTEQEDNAHNDDSTGD